MNNGVPKSVIWTGVLIAMLMGAAGCEDKPPPRSPASLTYTEDARTAYKEAMEAFDAREWEDARTLMQEVRRVFGYSRYAKLAELRIADVDFEQGKYSEAISGYRSYIRAHRGDPNAEYAKYRIGKALFLDISDTILLPPQEERDQAGTKDAYRELRAFQRRYPRSRYRVDASYMLEVVTQRLVRHELYVARYYLKEDNFVATVARVDYSLKHYSGSGLDPEALVLKGETLLKMKKPKQAREVFERVIRDYGAPFGRVAKRFLDGMQGAGAGEPAAKPDEPAAKPAEPSKPVGAAGAQPVDERTATGQPSPEVTMAAEKIPMTPNGVQKLRGELRHLKEAELPKVVREIAVAREHGDLSENAEYHAAKERQGMLMARSKHVENTLAHVEVIDPSKLSGDRVRFGAKVSLLNVETDEEVRYEILGPEEADTKLGQISIASPLARALIGREVGDEVTIRLPGGTRTFEIQDVSFG